MYLNTLLNCPVYMVSVFSLSLSLCLLTSQHTTMLQYYLTFVQYIVLPWLPHLFVGIIEVVKYLMCVRVWFSCLRISFSLPLLTSRMTNSRYTHIFDIACYQVYQVCEELIMTRQYSDVVSLVTHINLYSWSQSAEEHQTGSVWYVVGFTLVCEQHSLFKTRQNFIVKPLNNGKSIHLFSVLS